MINLFISAPIHAQPQTLSMTDIDPDGSLSSEAISAAIENWINQANAINERIFIFNSPNYNGQPVSYTIAPIKLTNKSNFQIQIQENVTVLGDLKYFNAPLSNFIMQADDILHFDGFTGDKDEKQNLIDLYPPENLEHIAQSIIEASGLPRYDTSQSYTYNLFELPSDISIDGTTTFNPAILWLGNEFWVNAGACRQFIRSYFNQYFEADNGNTILCSSEVAPDGSNVRYEWNYCCIGNGNQNEAYMAHYDAAMNVMINALRPLLDNIPIDFDLNCIRDESLSECERLRDCEVCGFYDECNNYLFDITGCSDFSIVGAGSNSVIDLQSDKYKAGNSDICEFRIAFALYGCDNVLFQDIKIINTASACINIDGLSPTTSTASAECWDPSENIIITGCVFNNFEWAAVGMMNVNGVTIDNCAFVGSTGLTGSAIAIEPNYTFTTNTSSCPNEVQWVRNINVNGSYFNNNTGFHFYIHSRNADTYHNERYNYEPAQFYITNCFFDGPGGWGLHYECDNIAPHIYPQELNNPLACKGIFNIENCAFRIGQYPDNGGGNVPWGVGIDGGNGFYDNAHQRYFFSTRYKFQNCIFFNDNIANDFLSPFFALRPIKAANSSADWRFYGGVEFINSGLINHHTWQYNPIRIDAFADMDTSEAVVIHPIFADMKGVITVRDKGGVINGGPHPCWDSELLNGQCPEIGPYSNFSAPIYSYAMGPGCYDNQLFSDFPYTDQSQTELFSDLTTCGGCLPSWQYMNESPLCASFAIHNSYTLQLTKEDQSELDPLINSTTAAIENNCTLLGDISGYLDSPSDYCNATPTSLWNDRYLVQSNETWSVLSPVNYEENRPGHVIVYPGVTLTIHSKTGFAPGAALILLPGSHLVINKAALMNSCLEKRWRGIYSLKNTSELANLSINSSMDGYSSFVYDFNLILTSPVSHIDINYCSVWNASCGLYARKDFISCTNSNFNNNGVSVYINDTGGGTMYKVSRLFSNIRFSTRKYGFNDYYSNIPHAGGHVILKNSSLCVFEYCNFDGTDQYTCNDNMGLISDNSNYMVDNCIFSKCKIAIEACNMLPTPTHGTVRGSHFKENLLDIYISGIVGETTIKNNSFKTSIKLSDASTWSGYNTTQLQQLAASQNLIYGIVAQGPNNFHIEGNSFTGYDEAIYTINTGDEYNVIENNEFINCRGGATASGNNKYLSYYCNYFDETAYDMSVIKHTALNGSITLGAINEEQHRPIGQGEEFFAENAGPEDPASNMFHINCDELSQNMHLYGEEDFFVPYTYYCAYIPGYEQLIPTCNTDLIEVTILENVDEVNPNCHPDEVYILPAQLVLPTDEDIDSHVSIKNELAEMYSTFDSGNPGYLLNLINTAPNQSSTQNQLIAASPYLSNDVLWAIASNASMTNGRKLARLIANSPLDPGLLTEMAPYLSQNMSNVLWSSVNAGQISPSKALKIEINSAERRERKISNEIVHKYLQNDSIRKAIYFLESSEKYEDYIKSIALGIKELPADEMEIKIQSMPTYDTEKANMKTIMEVNHQINRQGAAFLFESSIASNVINISSSGGFSSYYAQNLIRFLTNHCFHIPLPERPDPSGKATRLLYNPDISDEDMNYFLIAPNPTADFINISMIGISGDGEYRLAIYDLLGRVIYNSKISINNNATISTADFQTGTYILELQDESGFSYTEKLILTR